MTLLRIAAAVCLAISAAPAIAADLPLGPAVLYPAPRAVFAKPFYVIDQGPDYTGPGIIITQVVTCDPPPIPGYPYVTSREIETAGLAAAGAIVNPGLLDGFAR